MVGHGPFNVRPQSGIHPRAGVHRPEMGQLTMTDYKQPTSEWEHSHALEDGDELIDTGEDTAITVKEVNEDGSVEVCVWIDQRHGQEYTVETWTEEQARTGLSDGIIETVDGLSHELATF